MRALLLFSVARHQRLGRVRTQANQGRLEFRSSSFSAHYSSWPPQLQRDILTGRSVTTIDRGIV